jgi:hypothetical protein
MITLEHKCQLVRVAKAAKDVKVAKGVKDVKDAKAVMVAAAAKIHLSCRLGLGPTIIAVPYLVLGLGPTYNHNQNYVYADRYSF